jgi:hypothetical protein
MAQLSTNTIFYDQLIKRVQKFLRDYASNTFSTEKEAASEYHKLLTDINNYSTEPITKYEQVIKGEPPSSSKFNRFIESVAYDLNIIAKQLDYQSAQVVSMYNLFNAEVEKENSFTNRVKSKVRILQAYSESPGNDLYYFSDSFENMDFVDTTKTPSSSLLSVKDGSAQLPIASSRDWKPRSISVNTDDSNGFIGNNHMVYAISNIDTTYRYYFQDNGSIGLISNVIDANPLTYFEYEGINVDQQERKNKNAKDFEFLYSYEENVNGNKVVKYKSWADNDTAQPLKLSLKLSSATAQMSNSITIVPYFGVAGSSYSEIKVVRITAVSQSTKEVVELIKKPLYIGSSFVPQSVESSKNYFYNKATVSFPEINTSEINVYFEENNYNDTKIQHMYWQALQPSNTQIASLDTKNRFDPTSLESLGFGTVQYALSDLVPNILQPNKFKDKSILENNVINVTFKNGLNSDKYLISFERTTGTPPSTTTKKMYYTNYSTGLESNAIQQEKTATSDINLAFYYETAEDAQRNIDYIQSKITNTEWSGSNYGLLKVETIKTNLAPKAQSVSIWLKKQFEIYPAKRACIGLRSIDVQYNSAQPSGELVSKPYVFPYNVKNLTLSVDSSINSSIVNYNQSYIHYYVSIGNEDKWIQISPIEDPFSGVPEVLSFNENLQNTLSIKGVSYFDYPEVPKDTTSIRVKIKIDKPSYDTATPIIYSYKIAGRVEQL